MVSCVYNSHTNDILENALEQGMDRQRKIAAINAPTINTCTKSRRKRFPAPETLAATGAKNSASPLYTSDASRYGSISRDYTI